MEGALWQDYALLPCAAGQGKAGSLIAADWRGCHGGSMSAYPTPMGWAHAMPRADFTAGHVAIAHTLGRPQAPEHSRF